MLTFCLSGISELLSEEGVVQWAHNREAMEDAQEEGEQGGDHTVVNATNEARVKLFREPQVQAFVAWVQEEDEDEEEDDEEDEEEE